MLNKKFPGGSIPHASNLVPKIELCQTKFFQRRRIRRDFVSYEVNCQLWKASQIYAMVDVNPYVKLSASTIP